MLADLRRPGLLVLVGACALGACGQAPSRLTVCGRGDREALAGELAGGTFEISFLGPDGRRLGSKSTDADRPTTLDGKFPAGAVAIDIVGKGAEGGDVARGHGVIEGQGSCVCLTLSGDFEFLCEGIGCRESEGACEFFDLESGGSDAMRTVTLSPDPDAPYSVDVADTHLVGQSTQSFGGAQLAQVRVDAASVALVRVPMSAIPGSVEIMEADLVLSTSAVTCESDEEEASCTVAAYRLIEAWDEGDGDGDAGCPNWNCRQEGVLWTVPGAGAVNQERRSRSLAIESAVEFSPGAETVTVSVTQAARSWQADPGSNHGVVLLAAEGTDLRFVTSEGEASLGPRLTLRLRLDETQPYAPDAGAPDGMAGADAGLEPEMVSVPGGTFVMGCDLETVGCGDHASPKHSVTLMKDFEIDRTEVTQAAYAECVAGGACSVPACDYEPESRPGYPVSCVTWRQASDYCAFRGKRLPTEAEWERAARGDDERRFPWGEEEPTCQLANFVSCSGVLLPVGSLPAGAGPYGAVDQAGNVREWVAPGAGTYTADPVTDPGDPDQAVLRGGSRTGSTAWMSTWRRIRVALPSDQYDDYTGFRCARDAAE